MITSLKMAVLAAIWTVYQLILPTAVILFLVLILAQILILL